MRPRYYDNLPELGKITVIKTIYIARSPANENYFIDANNDEDALDAFVKDFPGDGYILNKYETFTQGFCICS